MKENSSLSYLTILGYGLGHVFNDICASMWFTYLLLFFQKVLAFSSTNSGLLMLVGQFADGISTTVVGLLADRIAQQRICRWYGKRKSIHLLGSTCVALSFPFIFLPCLWKNLKEESQMIYYSCFVVLFQFGWAATQISHLALITDLTNSETVRTTLTSVRYGFTVISSILVYFTTWMFLGLEEGSQNVDQEDAGKFRNIMLVGIGVGITASFGFHISVKESSDHHTVEQFKLSSIEESKATVPKLSVLSWLKNPQMYLVAAIYMSTRLFVNLSQAYIPFYLQDSLKEGNTYLAVIPLVMMIASFFSSFLTSLSNKHLGRNVTWLAGAVVGCAAALYIQLGAGHFLQQYGIFLVAVMLGASSCVLLITSLGLTADLIGENTSSSALVYGLMSLTDKVANGLAVIFIQKAVPCLKLTGMVEMPDTVATIAPCTACITSSPTQIPTINHNNNCFSFYKHVLFYSTGGSAVFGAVFVIISFIIASWRKNHIKKTPFVN